MTVHVTVCVTVLICWHGSVQNFKYTYVLYAIGTQYRNKYRITMENPIKNSDVYSGSVERREGVTHI
jgi:hypothetical protein